jgi:hypothetical protein
LAKNPETIFKEKALADLRALPRTWAEKIQQVAICGTPDILACVNGYFVAIELKKDAAARVEPIQDYELARIKRARGMAVIAHPGNWRDILMTLEMVAHIES